ncbi:MAG: ABC transporter permease subunit [Oscillospiraceae bacterium]|nr:ABC transporter permease subunit [Oscillospiraceae bacterium]
MEGIEQQPITVTERKKSRFRSNVQLAKRNYMLYIFLLPACLYIAIFNYGPLYGIQIAFRNYTPAKGIFGSPWVGLRWLEMFFSSPRFLTILGNTVGLSFYQLLAGFPMPIILALIINNVLNMKFKRFAQTVTYMPHFISTVVMVGMISVFFSPRSGIVNTLLGMLGGSGDTYFLGIPAYFQHLYIWTGVWQGAGWGSIIYIAALTGVNPELHESAMIDGASKLKRIWHIDLPTIMPTMVILLILNCGSIMNVSFEKIFLMQNALNQSVSEVISTYTFKIGLQQYEYSYSTAIGLFNNVVNFTVLIIVNFMAGRLSGSSLW